jgi:hypothetical protein
VAGTFDIDGTAFAVPVTVVTLAENRPDYGSPQEVADVRFGGLEKLVANAPTLQVTGTDGADPTA